MGIVLMLLVFNLIAMAPEMYLPFKKKFYHHKITQQLYKIKKQQELEKAEKKEKRLKAEAERELKLQQVKFADFEAFKRRFPATKEEAQQYREERILEQEI